MKAILASVLIAAGISLAGTASAGVLPVGGVAIEQSAVSPSDVQQTQYVVRRTRRGIVKCYRELVFGPYVCHRYRYW